MINRISNPINRNRSAAKISKVMSSKRHPLPKKWSAATHASSRARITSVKSQQGQWWSDWQGKAMIGLGSDKNYHDYNIMRKKPWWIWYDDKSVMVQKTVMITIWWQNRDDYDMMTVQGWGLTPGRAPATRPPLPPTLSATRPAQIVFLHSCSSVFVTSTNCISSLIPKCICNQRKLYFFTHAQAYL